jgi:hypothetical protein
VRPGGRVAAELRQPVGHRRHGPLREVALGRQLGLRQDEQARVAQPLLDHQVTQVVDGGLGAGVDAVEHHRDLRLARGRLHE